MTLLPPFFLYAHTHDSSRIKAWKEYCAEYAMTLVGAEADHVQYYTDLDSPNLARYAGRGKLTCFSKSPFYENKVYLHESIDFCDAHLKTS